MNDNTRTHMATGVERLASRTYTLQITAGPDTGQEYSSKSRIVRIGTNPDCEVELNDPTASRLHARIEIDPLGHRLMDEDSKNGTFVNGLRIRDVYLKPGSTISIGDSIIEYQTGAEELEIHLSKNREFGRMLGTSAAMREIFAILSRVSPTDTTLLVEGESGTGKELVADAVHNHSKRQSGPFVVFDCSAIAHNLIESELFGHVKGAFTGAASARRGAFERAHGGTLFLDEIGELPLDLQPKLLRALEQRAIQPVGGDGPISVDTRIIAATNRNLAKEVELGQFRQDLYYRLAVIRCVLPPLRRRPEDIPLLVNHFLGDFQTDDAAPIQVGYETILKLQQHRWPGNIRELRNFVERAALLSSGERLETRHLAPPSFGDTQTQNSSSSDIVDDALSSLDPEMPFKNAKARLVDQFERAYWTRLLAKTNGNVSAAARIAGIHRKSAEYLLKKLDLKHES